MKQTQRAKLLAEMKRVVPWVKLLASIQPFYYSRPLQKGSFCPQHCCVFANAHLLLNKLRFAAELKNKNIRFLHAVSSYAKL